MDPVTIGALAAAGAVCIAAGAYRIGYRRGLATDHARAAALNHLAGSLVDSGQVEFKQPVDYWHRRAQAMGLILRNLGYQVLEIEDPDSGKVTYQATLTQPAQRLPLTDRPGVVWPGPSLS